MNALVRFSSWQEKKSRLLLPVAGNGVTIVKPNYDAMTRKELRAYILAHRDDADAIHAMILKIKADPNTKWYKPEDTDRFPEIYEEHRQRREAEQQSQEQSDNHS